MAIAPAKPPSPALRAAFFRISDTFTSGFGGTGKVTSLIIIYARDSRFDQIWQHTDRKIFDDGSQSGVTCLRGNDNVKLSYEAIIEAAGPVVQLNLEEGITIDT
jgi:hypothetical protein